MRTKKKVWATTKLAGNFGLAPTLSVRVYRNMNEMSVSLGIETKIWSGYLYLSAKEARKMSTQLKTCAAQAEKEFHR